MKLTPHRTTCPFKLFQIYKQEILRGVQADLQKMWLEVVILHDTAKQKNKRNEMIHLHGALDTLQTLMDKYGKEIE